MYLIELIKWLNLICLFGCEGEIFHTGTDAYSQDQDLPGHHSEPDNSMNSFLTVLSQCAIEEYVLT